MALKTFQLPFVHHSKGIVRWKRMVQNMLLNNLPLLQVWVHSCRGHTPCKTLCNYCTKLGVNSHVCRDFNVMKYNIWHVEWLYKWHTYQWLKFVSHVPIWLKIKESNLASVLFSIVIPLIRPETLLTSKHVHVFKWAWTNTSLIIY